MDAPPRKTQPRATRGAGGAAVAMVDTMTITDRARNAALTMCNYIAGYGVVVSAEDADAAGRVVFEELDKLQTIIGALTRRYAVGVSGGVLVGFLLGAFCVAQAVIVGGTHP